MFNKITKIKFEYADLKAITFFVFLTVFGILTSCGESPEPIQGTENWENEELTITVDFYENQQRLDMAYKELVNPEDQLSRKGFAIWYQGIPECEIHMLKIKHKNDDDGLETLGHEMLHCIRGSWHQEITF